MAVPLKEKRISTVILVVLTGILIGSYLNSIVDPQAWLKQACQWLVVPDTGELPPILGQAVARHLRRELDWQHRDCARAAESVRSRYSAAAYIADILENHAEQLSQWVASAGSPQAVPEALTTLGGQAPAPSQYSISSQSLTASRHTKVVGS